jgi:hypothetical protein
VNIFLALDEVTYLMGPADDFIPLELAIPGGLIVRIITVLCLDSSRKLWCRSGRRAEPWPTGGKC